MTFLPTDTRVFLTVAVDLVVYGIQEPVRFSMESKAKIFPQNERFWSLTKRPQQEQFYVNLRLVSQNFLAHTSYREVLASVFF